MQEQIGFARRYANLSKRLHIEINNQYIDGCIHWVNVIYEGAWDSATDRFERSLLAFREKKITEERYAFEEEIFFDTLKEYMRKYKKYKKVDDEMSFIKSLTQGDNQ